MKSFAISEYGLDQGQKHVACKFVLNKTRYYSSSSAISIGDFVYTSNSILTPFNGNNKLYAIAGGRVIKINSSGKITDMQYC